jgi:tetratricopeptide (TPR) repeat protein
MRLRLFLILLTASVGLISCKSDKGKTDVPEVDALEKSFLENPTDENFSEIITTLAELIGNAPTKDGKQRFILKGIELSKAHSKDKVYYIFIKEYIRYYSGDKLSADYIWELAEYLDKNGSGETADILKAGFKSSFPSDKRSQQIGEEQMKIVSDIDGLIRSKAEAIFVNPDQTGLNPDAVRHYIDICEAVVLAYHQDKMAGEYLFRAAEMARSMRSFQKSMSLYDWILTSYPDFDKAAMVFFLRGFIFENELKQKDKAAAVYKTFLEKYPNDPMVPDVRFLLDNIDKTEDEMLKLIEERRKAKATDQ